MTKKIIILHGWKVSASRYEKLQALLEERRYKVYAPDLPGNGVEPEPEHPFALDDYADWVLEFMDSKKIKKAIVIGHSFGGRVGLKIAEKKPAYIEKLILTGTPGYSPVPELKLKFYILLAKLGNIMFSMPLLYRFKRITREIYHKLVNAGDFYRTEGVMRQTFKNIVQEDLQPAMSQISFPTILIYGQNDELVPAWIPAKMARRITNAQLKIVTQAGHDLPFSRPEEIINLSEL